MQRNGPANPNLTLPLYPMITYGINESHFPPYWTTVESSTENGTPLSCVGDSLFIVKSSLVTLALIDLKYLASKLCLWQVMRSKQGPRPCQFML